MDPAPMSLRFRDGAFTIAQFTDLHITGHGSDDRRTLACLDRVLEAERVDLAVFTGDLIAGGQAKDPGAALRLAVSPVVARGLPLAVLWGNHDDEGSLDRKGLQALARRLPGCLSRDEAPGVKGQGNQVIRVAGADGRPAAALHCFDSHAYATGMGSAYAPVLGSAYAWMGASQMDWHREECARLEGERPDWARALPELAFFHIPLPQHRQAWDLGARAGVRQEDECHGLRDEGFFDALAQAGHVLAAFCGHDHLNDYVALHQGLALGYGRASGHGAYGAAGYARGARLLRLREGRRDLETWLRLEDGRREQDLGSLRDLGPRA